MKTKWNLLIILALMAALIGVTASPAQAARPVARCVNPGDVNFWPGSGATFNFCTNKAGVVDTYNVRMIRAYETYYDYSVVPATLRACKGTAVNFKSLGWVFTDPAWFADWFTFDLYTYQGQWSQLRFVIHIFPAISPVSGAFDISVLNYQWRCPNPEAKLAVESETKINGTSLGIITNVYDHFDGDLYHDGGRLFP